MSDVNERLDSLRGLIQSPEFLEGKGLSNEVQFSVLIPYNRQHKIPYQTILTHHSIRVKGENHHGQMPQRIESCQPI